MPHPRCFPGSTFGPCPDLYKNFDERSDTVAIFWDDSIVSVGQDESFFKVAIACEPKSVLDLTEAFIARHKEFDLILAHDQRILSECPNAKFLTESCCSFLPKKAGGVPFPILHYFEGYGKGPLSPTEENYIPCDATLKEFSVSYLTSSKAATVGHQLRQEIYDKLPSSVGDLRVYKHRSPPRIEDKRSVLNTFQYHICIENGRYAGYYSEKIVDAFMTKCIPIYNGAQDIGKHFNPEGILLFENWDELHRKLLTLTPGFYRSRTEAIEENYQRALRRAFQWDQIEAYLNEGIRSKHEVPVSQTIVVPTVPRESRFTRRPLRRI